MSKLIDLTGKTFGHLKVISKAGNTCAALWLCQCDCGNTKTFRSDHLRRVGTKTCGCHLMKRGTPDHHESQCRTTKEYRAWLHMKGRCYTKTDHKYHRYGGRGITVCDRWLESYNNFLEDMGRAPSVKHSVDRIDVNGNYEPENCRWATILEQANNRTTNMLVEYNGKKMSLRMWQREIGFNYGTTKDRILKYGWSVKEAFEAVI